MKAIYALYQDDALAQQAIDALRSAGVPDRDITILSPEPREDCAFSGMHSSTWMWWYACGGGLVGAVGAAGLAYMTEVSWPLDVGGLPVVAWWPNLIIVFEMAMLGAIVATVISMIVSTGLAGLSSGIYDTAVTDGYILVGVDGPRDSMAHTIRRALENPGDVHVHVLP